MSPARAHGAEVDATTVDRRLERLVGVALFAYYLLTLGGHQYSIDGIVMFQSAKRLFFHQSFVLDPPVVWGRAVFASGGWSAGMALAYLPVLAVMSPVFLMVPEYRETPFLPGVPYNPALYWSVPYLLCSWLNPLIVAVTGALVFRLARQLTVTPGWALAAALAFGVCSPAGPYARFDFAQPLAGLLLTAAVCRLLATDALTSLWPLPAAGAILGGAVFTRPEFGVLVAWIVLWDLVRARATGLRALLARLVLLAGPVALSVGLYFLANWFRFGSAARTGYGSPTRMFFRTSAGTLNGIAGMLVSPEVGLLLLCPLAWLTLPGLVRLVRERNPAGVLLGGIVGIAIVMYGSFIVWWAGDSWGPRFLVPVVPFVVVAAAFWTFRLSAAHRRCAWVVFLGLAALGFVVTLSAILVDPLQRIVHIPQVDAPRYDAARHFRIVASPVVSIWKILGRVPLDLLGIHLLRGGHVMFAALWAVAALGLSACIAWAGYRMLRLVGAPAFAAARAPASRRAPGARRQRAGR
jgi:hypothetical protein